MNIEDGLSLSQVGQVYVYLTVETACTEQCLVEHVYSVGGSEHDNTRVGAEAVHLGEQGVEGVLSLVVAAGGGALAAGSSYGVNLVDEDDAGCFLLGLTEYVAHAAGSYADKHLDKVGTAHREERHVGLACHGFGQQRLTGSGRADKQRSLGDFTSELGKLLWFFQELHYLGHLLLGAFLTSHILECDAHLAGFLVELGFTLADIEYAAAGSATVHAVHEEEPYEDEQQEGTEVVE